MSNYSSPTTDIEVKVGICENPGPCWQCGRNIRKDERYVLIACYDKEADMHFGQGYCSIECLQEDFAEMMAEKDEEIIYPRLQPQEKGKKWYSSHRMPTLAESNSPQKSMRYLIHTQEIQTRQRGGS